MRDTVSCVQGCMCASNAVYGVCMRVCALNYVMITCASQIHDVLVNDMFPVRILVIEHVDKTIE